MMVSRAPQNFAAASSTPAVRRRGFTLVEVAVMAAGVALLMGVAVSLSHSVRDRSSVELTRNILDQLERASGAYIRQHHQPPVITPVLGPAGDEVDESVILANALQNNREMLKVMQFTGSELPATVFDPGTGSSGRKTLRDAWGSPIVLVVGRTQRLGLSPDDRPYFVSAGPDRKFLTREDNLYGYEGVTVPADVP